MKRFILPLSFFILSVGCSMEPIRIYSNGMKVYHETVTHGQQFEHGKGPVHSAKLAANFKNSAGAVYKKDTTIYYYENSSIKKYTLAKNWKNPRTGMVLAAGKSVRHFENGNYDSYVLAENFTNPKTAMVFMAGKRIYFHANSIMKQVTLAENWKEPKTGMVFKAGEEQFFHTNGHMAKIFLAERWDHHGGVISAVKDSVLECTNKNKLKRCTLASDVKFNKFAVLKSGTEAGFKNDGTLKKGTFRKQWKDPKTGTVYEADKEYTF